MSALAVDSEDIDTLVYTELDGKYRGLKTQLLVEQLIKVEEKYLLCSYCSGLMREACLLEEEGKQELRCVTCIPEGVTGQPALLSRESINEKLIWCPSRERGCDWGDTVCKLIQHLNECGFLLVVCPLKCVESKSGEVVRLERRQVAEHEREYCPQRVLSCEFCSREVRACEMNPHLGECDEFPVDCPNSCDVAGETGTRQLKRGEVPLHLADKCPLQSVRCPYWDYGCEEKIGRRQLDLHEREFIHIHFKLAMKGMRRVEQKQIESNDKIQLLEKQNAELKETISTLIPTGRLEMEFEEVKQKIENKESTYSDQFYVGMYKCQCSVHWNHNNTGNVGCFICIMKGQFDVNLKWPFIYRLNIVLLNQNRSEEDLTWSTEVTKEDLQNFPGTFQRPTSTRNYGWGLAPIITNAELLTDKYCRYDTISLHLTVEQLPHF